MTKYFNFEKDEIIQHRVTKEKFIIINPTNEEYHIKSLDNSTELQCTRKYIHEHFEYPEEKDNPNTKVDLIIEIGRLYKRIGHTNILRLINRKISYSSSGDFCIDYILVDKDRNEYNISEKEFNEKYFELYSEYKVEKIRPSIQDQINDLKRQYRNKIKDLLSEFLDILLDVKNYDEDYKNKILEEIIETRTYLRITYNRNIENIKETTTNQILRYLPKFKLYLENKKKKTLKEITTTKSTQNTTEPENKTSVSFNKAGIIALLKYMTGEYSFPEVQVHEQYNQNNFSKKITIQKGTFWTEIEISENIDPIQKQEIINEYSKQMNTKFFPIFLFGNTNNKPKKYTNLKIPVKFKNPTSTEARYTLGIFGYLTDIELTFYNENKRPELLCYIKTENRNYKIPIKHFMETYKLDSFEI